MLYLSCTLCSFCSETDLCFNRHVFQAFSENDECRLQLPETAKMSRPQAVRQSSSAPVTGSAHHPNSNINLDEVGEGESLESKMVLPDDFDDVIKDMVGQFNLT